MRDIDPPPPHVKETSLTCSLVINWIRKAACSFRMFERSGLPQHRLLTFFGHYASHEVSCGMLTKMCSTLINYLNLLCFLHFPFTVWSHIFTGCSQRGKVTFGNTIQNTKQKSNHYLNVFHLWVDVVHLHTTFFQSCSFTEHGCMGLHGLEQKPHTSLHDSNKY